MCFGCNDMEKEIVKFLQKQKFLNDNRLTP